MAKGPNKSELAGTKFKWNVAKEQAALLLAQDELTDEAIADQLGTGRTTLWEWKQRPEFDARVEAHREEWRKRVRKRGIAVAENRVAALQDRWERMKRIIAERGEADIMQDVPGGRTGLLCYTKKSLGAGPMAQVVDEFELDAALLRELREHEKQAAQELGQWTDRQDVTSDGKALEFWTVNPDGNVSEVATEVTEDAG